MAADIPNRFFVEVRAETVQAVRRLHTFGMDLFRSTAREHDESGYRIEGLLTLEEVGQLVEAGYPVLVAEEASRRAAAAEISDFGEWLQARAV